MKNQYAKFAAITLIAIPLAIIIITFIKEKAAPYLLSQNQPAEPEPVTKAKQKLARAKSRLSKTREALAGCTLSEDLAGYCADLLAGSEEMMRLADQNLVELRRMTAGLTRIDNPDLDQDKRQFMEFIIQEIDAHCLQAGSRCRMAEKVIELNSEDNARQDIARHDQECIGSKPGLLDFTHFDELMEKRR